MLDKNEDLLSLSERIVFRIFLSKKKTKHFQKKIMNVKFFM